MAQVDTALKIGADYGIVAFLLIGLALFVGAASWKFGMLIFNATVGPEGYMRAASEKQTITMERNSTTLVKFQDLAANQQKLCGLHATELDVVGQELVQLNEKVTETAGATDTVAASWGGRNHREYKTTYLIDLASEAVDTIGRIAKDRGIECETDLQSLRTKIAEAKQHIHQGDEA